MSPQAESLMHAERVLFRAETNATVAAIRAYEAGCLRAEQHAKREADIRDELVALVAAGNLDAEVADEDTRITYSGGVVGERAATLFDVLYDLTDYADFDKRLIEVFVRAANGAHVQADAQELLAQMAEKYASLRAE